MKPVDQCPSTTGTHGKPARPGKGELAAVRRDTPTLNGRPLWRSLDEIADTPEFREHVEREFPAGASELLKDTRRDFIKIMGAAFALAGIAAIPGCRRPDHKIMPYSREVPEEVIPGQPMFYASALFTAAGYAEGVLVETHEARPTKVEGNPLHPVSRGKSSLWAQASVLELYDPNRRHYPEFFNAAQGKRLEATWDDFASWSAEHFKRFDATQGQGLVFVVDKVRSPSRDAMRDRVLARWPKAVWAAWDALQSDSSREATRGAFGVSMREILDFSKARRVVSLDRDFMEGEANALRHARDFASLRGVTTSSQEPCRLYMAESTFSGTGSMADHRLSLAPSRISALAVLLAKELASRVSMPRELGAAIEAIAVSHADEFDHLAHLSDTYKREGGSLVKAIVDDLLEHRGECVIVAGPSQPAPVHALVIAMNEALGNVGSTVRYAPMSPEEAASAVNGLAGRGAIRAAHGLADVVDQLKAGQTDTIVCVNVNPVYDAPADYAFADLWAKVPYRIAHCIGDNETEANATWSLNAAHALESWGDAEGYDGSIAPVQPMIAPIYEGRSDLELLAIILGEAKAGYDIVRDTWKSLGPTWFPGGAFDFEKVWKRALHDGVLAGASGTTPTRVEADGPSLAAFIATFTPAEGPTDAALELTIVPGKLRDGRYANCGWLQELPEMATRIAWEGPACVSPATAKRLGLEPENDAQHVFEHKLPEGKVAQIKAGGLSLNIPVWVLPGMPDNVVQLTTGYGRTRCGNVGTGIGDNSFAIRSSSFAGHVAGATLARATGSRLMPTTQNHWSLENRTAVVRQMDLKWWRKYAQEFEQKEHGREVKVDPLYGTRMELNLAEKLGELSHAPPNISIYAHPYNKAPSVDGHEPEFDSGKQGPAPGSVYSKGQQWGMTIDLARCNGCGVCTVACQSENNIPIVGPKEVAKGREMTWIRVDRYYTGSEFNSPDQMIHQPVACVQCENAPCETVCPVNATVHGPEGINYMVYNRCIGTRYCANNCPYKVRRFNFFDYAPSKYNGKFYGEQALGGGPKNRNLIPPRLREKLDEIQKMRQNPDVTVRSRGVMEKCNYCIQRINQARIETKVRDIASVPDGFFEVACQQACPTDAIVFGDINDAASRVTKERAGQRSYMLLGYLNTRPRTTYLFAVRNRNERLVPAHELSEDPLMHHGGEHHDDHAPAGDGHDEPHAFFSPARRDEDAGYALSLKVLGAANGVHA